MKKQLVGITFLALLAPTAAQATSINNPAPTLTDRGLQIMDARLSHNDGAIVQAYLQKCKNVTEPKQLFICTSEQTIKGYDRIFDKAHISYGKAVREYLDLVIDLNSKNEDTMYRAKGELESMNLIWHKYLQVGMKCSTSELCAPWAFKNKYLYSLSPKQEKAVNAILVKQGKKAG